MKKFYWMIAAILTISGAMALTSCSDKDDNSVNEPVEESVEYLVDPSTRWQQREEPTFIAGIGALPMEFQQALGQTFTNVVSNLDNAEIAIMDMDAVAANFDELDEFYENGGLLIIIPKGDENLLKAVGFEDLSGWDELLWACHNESNDDFYLMNEPDEITSIDENGKEYKRKIEKDLNYYLDRLIPLTDWMDWYKDEIIRKATEKAASARHRAEKGESEMPDFENLTLSLNKNFKHFTVNFPFSLDKEIFPSFGWYSSDILRCNGSITLAFDVMPLYMGSVNGNDKAGDYYAVRSTITPHNQTMWNPYVASHGLDKNRIYGYWFTDMDYKIMLIDPETKQIAQGLQFVQKPFPENSITSRDKSSSFTFGLEGSVSAADDEVASVGFKAEWTESVNYSVKNIDFDRSTASGNMVEYHWYSNNVTVKDDWDNIEKNFPVEVHREFDATNVWLWRIPYGKAGVQDESNKQFTLATYVHPRYSSWYHWKLDWFGKSDKEKQDYDVDFWNSCTSVDPDFKPEADYSKHGWICCSFNIPAPDRGKWGLISLKNASKNYTMRNVRIYKKGEEDKDPAVKVSNTYEPKESAEAAVKVGIYTVTFEFIDPDTNKVISKGKLTDVEVEMGKNKQEATSSLSTGDAELTEL